MLRADTDRMRSVSSSSCTLMTAPDEPLRADDIHLRGDQRLAQVLHEVGLLVLGVHVGIRELRRQRLAALQVEAAGSKQQQQKRGQTPFPSKWGQTSFHTTMFTSLPVT